MAAVEAEGRRAGKRDRGRRQGEDPESVHVRFPGEHPVFLSLVWTTRLLVVFAPLAVRKYRSIDR